MLLLQELVLEVVLEVVQGLLLVRELEVVGVVVEAREGLIQLGQLRGR